MPWKYFFLALLRWRFKICLLISNTRMLRWNGGLENGVLNFKRRLNDFLLWRFGSTFPSKLSKAITSTTGMKFDFYNIICCYWKGTGTANCMGGHCQNIRLTKLSRPRLFLIIYFKVLIKIFESNQIMFIITNRNTGVWPNVSTISI